uniref:dynein regulatory complex protein 9-like n=1 Tax=Semicossyphus pulcher TaxID=241346 RepID=UPI0037E9362D
MSSSRISSLRLAAVLEDCSEQLDILGYKLQISKERCTVVAQENSRLLWLRRDCQFISHHILKLHLELGEKQTFSSLLQVVEEQEQRKKAESIRREEKGELEQRKVTLKGQQQEFQQKTEKLKYVCQLAKDLTLQITEKSSKIANKKKIVEKTFVLQLQQTQKETSQTEKLQEKQLELLQKRLNEEKRIHEESEVFLQNQNEELQQQLLQCQKRTKQMQQEKEQQFNNVQCKRTIHLDRFMEKKRRFKEMELVVVEDRERQEKLQQQQAEVKAAIKLQAWWRGCMVCRGLTSFKKSEEDKKSKKNKKNKEGKKKKK